LLIVSKQDPFPKSAVIKVLSNAKWCRIDINTSTNISTN
jgi:hypothetical protein